jgi:ATP-dependent helicase YprA (DUF1998 family)
MKDPVGAFDSIRDNFILYLKTAFGTRFHSIEAEREELLRQPRVLCQEPWIEPLPIFQDSRKTVQDLTKEDIPGLSDQEIADFKSLVSCGLFGNHKLYKHQTEMLKNAVEGRNCVVTAGTGSGKTEAFLLPLFAYLACESSGWEAPATPYPHVDNWWNDSQWQESCHDERNWIQRSYRVSQRGHERREAAVRALIIASAKHSTQMVRGSGFSITERETESTLDVITAAHLFPVTNSISRIVEVSGVPTGRK